MFKIFRLVCLVTLMMGWFREVPALEKNPIDLQKIGITEHEGALLPLDLDFKNEAGETVPLKKFFDGTKPTILALVYYDCPNLCNLLMDGLVNAVKQMPWEAGNQFQIVAVSINPEETPRDASKKKEADGLAGHFLTGTKENIQKLADTVGFGFQYDETNKQYVHAAGFFVISPDGKISRTFYGTHFRPTDLKLALLEAGNGKIGNWVDKFLVFLFKYDSIERKYKFDIL